MSSVDLTVAVMYHPARDRQAAALLETCWQLAPVAVPDPDPHGVRSPLRTAKRAWALAGRGTHHLVLQDDVRLVPDFATQVRRAIAARPRDIIAFYVNWNSPHNSYTVRLAAAHGAPWAPLVPGEFVPTLGLAMPAAQAGELAVYLAGVPDDVRDDDALVDRFCRARGYRVLAAVPHLLEHAGDASVAGNDSHGQRRATVFAPDHRLPDGYWDGPSAPDLGAPMHAVGSPSWRHVVVLRRSACLIRFIRPTTREPVRHPFGPWADWCRLIGVESATVVEELAAHLASRPPTGLCTIDPALAVEIWAAGFLLGLDARGATPGWPELSQALTRRAICTWIDSGLTAHDAGNLDAESRSALLDLGLAGHAAGIAHGTPVGPGRRQPSLGTAR